MFSVYKISSDLTSSTYYGYCEGDDADALTSFLIGAKRKAQPNDPRRGASEWLAENKGKEDNINVEIVDGCTDELEAWCSRNDARTSDIFSITGASHWPAQLHNRAKENRPTDVAKWAKRMSVHRCSSARAAMQQGAFSFEQMKALSKQHGRDTVIQDMDSLSPRLFSERYNVPISFG